MSGLFTVRRAGGADVPSMFRIFNSELDDYFAPETLEWSMMQWPAGQLVAVSFTGETAGAINSYIIEEGTVSLALFAVDRRYRGRGAGSALLDALVFACRGAGMRRIQLEARVENASAIAFYSRRGFVRSCDLPGLYSNGGDGVRMVLDLGPSSAAGTPPWRRAPL